MIYRWHLVDPGVQNIYFGSFVILNNGIEACYLKIHIHRTELMLVADVRNHCWRQIEILVIELMIAVTNILNLSNKMYILSPIFEHFHQLIVNNINVPVKIGELAKSMLVEDIRDGLCWQLWDVGDRFEILVTDSSHQKSHQHHHCHFDRVFSDF